MYFFNLKHPEGLYDIKFVSVKDIAYTQNIDDRKNILNNSIANKHSKNLENLEKNKTQRTDAIKIPIVVKINSETGEIIDDRE